MGSQFFVLQTKIRFHTPYISWRVFFLLLERVVKFVVACIVIVYAPHLPPAAPLVVVLVSSLALSCVVWLRKPCNCRFINNLRATLLLAAAWSAAAVLIAIHGPQWLLLVLPVAGWLLIALAFLVLGRSMRSDEPQSRHAELGPSLDLLKPPLLEQSEREPLTVRVEEPVVEAKADSKTNDAEAATDSVDVDFEEPTSPQNADGTEVDDDAAETHAPLRRSDVKRIKRKARKQQKRQRRKQQAAVAVAKS